MNTKAPATARPLPLFILPMPRAPSTFPVKLACPAAVVTVHWRRSGREASKRRREVVVDTYMVRLPPLPLLPVLLFTAMPLSPRKEALKPGPPSPPFEEMPVPARVLTLRLPPRARAGRGTTLTL